MKNYVLRLVGSTPLVMHNARLSDPLDEYAQAISEISKKRGKTLDDHATISHREFLGGLYADDDGPYLPAENVQKCLVEAARRHKLGKDVERGLTVDAVSVPLQYDGPRSPEALWESGRFTYRRSVGIQKSRTMRTRPMFSEWAVDVPLVVDETLLDEHRLSQIAEEAGRYVGICERRPMFGKFDAELLAA